MGDVAWFAWLGCGEVELRAGGGNGGALVAVARTRRRKVAARACEDGVLRRRGPVVVAHGGGEVERRRRDGKAAARWNGERRRCVVGETREEERPVARGQEIYDKWPPRNFLTPVDPTLRVWMPVDCAGVVYPSLHQICISTPIEPMLPKMNSPVDCSKRRLIARSDLY